MRIAKIWNCIWIGLLLMPIILTPIYRMRHYFTPQKWIQNEEKRVEIVDDMLNRYSLIGMGKEEVVELLGIETSSTIEGNQEELIYYLGPERGFMSIDSEWLILTIKDHKVSAIEITTD